MLSPGPLIAGPAVLIRSLRAERIFEKRHPKYDHFLVWMFAVAPARQRGGLGRRLMAEALARADEAGVPAYLWTANPDNLPYYRSHGYEVIGGGRRSPDGGDQLVHGAARRGRDVATGVNPGLPP